MRVIDDIINKTLDVDISSEEQQIIRIMKANNLHELPPFGVQVMDKQGKKGVLNYRVKLTDNRLEVYTLFSVIFAPGVIMTGQRLVGPKIPGVVPIRWEPVIISSQKKALFTALLSENTEKESEQKPEIHLVN